MINNNHFRDTSKGASFWSRNLEMKDKKKVLAKFNSKKDDAIYKLHNCYSDFKVEKDWRKRLITNDRIDVLFNHTKKEYEHATIIEERIMPSREE